MKKTILTLLTILAINSDTFAGGNIEPIEPQNDLVKMENVFLMSNHFYGGMGYSSYTGSMNSNELDARGALAIIGYKINENLSVEGRYTRTLSNITFDNIEYDKLITNKALYFKPIYPIDNFSLYGLIGYGQTIANNTSGKGIQYGVGLQFFVVEGTDLFIDYTKLNKDIDSTSGRLRTFNIGALYSF